MSIVVNSARFMPAMILVLGGAGALWTMYVFTGSGTANEVDYALLAAWFVVLAAVYLGLIVHRSKMWFSIPVLITITGLIKFIALPTWRFINRDDRIDSNYVQAIAIVLIGYIAFWLGSWLLLKPRKLRFVAESAAVSERVMLTALSMLIVGMAATFLEWKLGIFSYMADSHIATSESAITQWLNACTQMMGGALLISGIEVMGNKPKSNAIKVVFYLSLIIMLAVGVVSGMKGALIRPFLLIIVLWLIIRGRIPRVSWVLIPFLYLGVYPFVTAYRDNLNAGYRFQANTVGGLEAALDKSASDAFAGRKLIDPDSLGDGFESSSHRLSMLGYIHDLVSIPDLGLLKGSEKVYMAPIYPFIPRAIWKGKPVLDKGRRFSAALGIPITSSTTLTLLGDMFALGGIAGVIGGMLVYGMVGQAFMNSLGEQISEKGVFFFVAILFVITNLEFDVVSMITSTVQNTVMFLAIAYFVYGGRFFSLHVGPDVQAYAAETEQYHFAAIR